MVPVPVTMQTFAVAMVGALCGWRLGSLIITAWLVEGAAGLPVLAGGASGVHHFLGPTGGYLFAFPVAGALMGWLAERGWNGDRVILAFLGMLLSNAVCLLLGAAWLAVLIGPERAIALGVMPFLVGALLKSALGAATLKLLARGRPRASA
jgi:biotin transport system substrate-specific component